jgi:molecular chaperone HtpG
MGQDVPERKRILEINPSHPIFVAMNRIFEEDRKSKVLEDYTDILYDQALLLEGFKTKRLCRLCKGDFKAYGRKRSACKDLSVSGVM